MTKNPNLAAWTAPGAGFPPYINASSIDDPRVVRVTVRAPDALDQGMNAISFIDMPRDAAKQFALELLQSIGDQELNERILQVMQEAARSGSYKGPW